MDAARGDTFHRALAPYRPCVACGALFLPYQSGHCYCSDRCGKRTRWVRDGHPARRPRFVGECVVCGRRVAPSRQHKRNPDLHATCAPLRRPPRRRHRPAKAPTNGHGTLTLTAHALALEAPGGPVVDVVWTTTAGWRHHPLPGGKAQLIGAEE